MVAAQGQYAEPGDIRFLPKMELMELNNPFFFQLPGVPLITGVSLRKNGTMSYAPVGPIQM